MSAGEEREFRAYLTTDPEAATLLGAEYLVEEVAAHERLALVQAPKAVPNPALISSLKQVHASRLRRSFSYAGIAGLSIIAGLILLLNIRSNTPEPRPTHFAPVATHDS